MMYCVGILVREGLVMIADTRTNAGVDNIATFRKLHMFERPGERSIGLCTAGNLSVSQSVVSHVVEGVENPATGEVETIMTVPTLFRAAQLVGRAIREGFLEICTDDVKRLTGRPARSTREMVQANVAMLRAAAAR